MAIVVVGSINADLTIQVPHFAVAHETVLGVGGFVTSQGGKGANQAVAAIAGGLPVAMVGKVGNDAFGKSAVAALRSTGVDCRHVQTDAYCATGIATIFVDPQGDNAITVASGANAQMTAADVIAATELIASAHIVMLQLEIPPAAVVEAIRIANENETLVMLDPAPASQILPELTGVDYLTPNEVEAELLVGIAATANDGPRQIVQTLLSRGAKHVALTLGKTGCYLSSENIGADQSLVTHIEARQVEAIDTTGAGDTFNGFLATGLAKGLGFVESAKLACAAATLSVTRSGARSHLPGWEEVRAFSGS